MSSAKNSVSSRWQTNYRLRGTHRALSPELGEGQNNSLSSVLATVLSETVFGPFATNRKNVGVAKGSSISWVAKFRGDKNSECKLSIWVVAKLQGDKTASLPAGK